MARQPRIAREPSRLERAGREICRIVYGRCACDNSGPGLSTCGSMERAAYGAAVVLLGADAACVLYMESKDAGGAAPDQIGSIRAQGLGLPPEGRPPE